MLIVVTPILETNITTIDGSCEPFNIPGISQAIQVVLFPEPTG
jgi:hypothetical protein